MHQVPIKQDTAMAKAYLIRKTPDSIEELEKEQGQRSKVFLGLPRDAMCAVLQHTAARFEVTCRTRVAPEEISLPHWWRWPREMPVLVRYEFRLLPRRACGTEMIAKFTLCLDPEIRQSQDWDERSQILSAAECAILDRQGAWLDHEFAPFWQLRFEESHHLGAEVTESSTNKQQHLSKRFCFLRRGEQPEDTEVAPRWSIFDDDVLEQVREKMGTVFGLRLLRFLEEYNLPPSPCA